MSDLPARLRDPPPAPAGARSAGRHVQTTIWPGELPPPRAVLLKEVAEVDGLLALLTDRVDAALLDAAPQLRVVSNFAVGYDNIDVAAATQARRAGDQHPRCAGRDNRRFHDGADAGGGAAGDRGRSVCARPAAGAPGGRRRCWGAIYGARRSGMIGHGPDWAGSRAPRQRLRDARYSTTARHASSTQEREGGPDYAPLEQLLAESDVVSLHCPLNDETYHLIDRDALELMKPERDPGQHRARPGGRYARAGRGAAPAADHRRARRDRPRAAAGRSPAAGAAERDRHAARRQRQRATRTRMALHGGRESAGGAARRAPALSGQPRGLARAGDFGGGGVKARLSSMLPIARSPSSA